MNSTFSQTVDSYGLKIGVANAEQKFNSSNWNNVSKSVWGLDVGIFAGKWDTNFISAQIEFHYIQKGKKFPVIGGAVPDPNSETGYREIVSEIVKETFHYFTIPILAKVNFKFDKVKPYMEFGPSINYLIKITDDAKYPYVTSIYSYNRFDYGIMLNVGTEISIFNLPNMLIEIDYNPSFQNLNIKDNPSVKNSTVSFLLGIVFR